jgi:hypothetical protein
MAIPWLAEQARSAAAAPPARPHSGAGPPGHWGDLSAIADHGNVVWLGDLNYRWGGALGWQGPRASRAPETRGGGREGTRRSQRCPEGAPPLPVMLAPASSPCPKQRRTLLPGRTPNSEAAPRPAAGSPQPRTRRRAASLRRAAWSVCWRGTSCGARWRQGAPSRWGRVQDSGPRQATGPGVIQCAPRMRDPGLPQARGGPLPTISELQAEGTPSSRSRSCPTPEHPSRAGARDPLLSLPPISTTSAARSTAATPSHLASRAAPARAAAPASPTATRGRQRRRRRGRQAAAAAAGQARGRRRRGWRSRSAARRRGATASSGSR